MSKATARQIILETWSRPMWGLMIEYFRADRGGDLWPKFALCGDGAKRSTMLFWTRAQAREFQRQRRGTTHPESKSGSYRTIVVKVHRTEHTVEVPR